VPSDPASERRPTWLVRPERPEDEPVVDTVVRAAFGGPEVPALLRDMRRDHSWVGLSFVAEREHPGDGVESGSVVGHVSYTRGWVDTVDRLVDVLVLSPLSVRPDVQRRGVGRALIHCSIEALVTRPEPVVFLEGDPAYYGRLGFRSAAESGFARPSVRIPVAAFQLWQLPAYVDDLSGALVYPDVFWRHDAVGLRR
jgi:putative acetyltransferase